MQENSTKDLIDAIENQYIDISNIFLRFMSADKTEEENSAILSLQEKLSRILYSISEKYHEKNLQKAEILKLRTETDKESFVTKMRCVSQEMEILKESVAIGRMIGDSFVWIFYKNDQQRLKQHLMHKELSLPPIGIGGKGEVEFISKIKYFQNRFVIYHGITSILRYGDISLANLENSRIVAVGELKTKEGLDSNNLKIQLTLIGNPSELEEVIKILPSHSNTNSSAQTFGELPTERMQARFVRQKQAMSAAENSVNEKIDKIEIRSEKSTFDKLAEVEKNTCDHIAMNAISECLFVFIIDDPEISFYERLSNKISESVIKGLMSQKGTNQSLAGHLFIRDRKDNQLIFSSISRVKDENPIRQNGIPPILWWPLDSVFRKNILLRKKTVVTVYNPAHLHKKLEENGFEKHERNGKDVYRCRKGNRFCELENLNYYHRLISESFFSIDSVIRLIMGIVTTGNHYNITDEFTTMEFLLSASY